MTTEEFERLLAYDAWANARVRTEIASHGPLARDEHANRLFSHVLSSQDVWLRRIEGAEGTADPWTLHSVETWAGLQDALQARWARVLDGSGGDLARVVRYVNSKGDGFATPLQDVLLHVIIHGQHHRAQLALVMRDYGITPPATDFIVFVRASQASPDGR